MATTYYKLYNTQCKKYNIIILIFVVCNVLLLTAFKYTTGRVHYTITFNSMGGSEISPQKVLTKRMATKPIDPTRKDYTFMGWYSDQALTKAFSFEIPITTNIVLYAKWKVNPGITSYTVNFNSNGGTPIADQVGVTESIIVKPTDPTLSGYTFGGWYTDPSFNKAYDFSIPIKASAILYAKWNNPSGNVSSLSNVLSDGIIPNTILNYDVFTQQVLSPYPAGAKVSAIYFTTNGTGNKNGTSWSNAKPGDDLQSTIENINDTSSNKVYLILMGAGAYTPSKSVDMKNNMAIIGGFSAAGGWTRSATDTTVIYRVNIKNANRPIFNNHNLDHTALLYGVMLTRSYRAMSNTNASPTIMNVVFSNNNSTAMYNDNSSPLITNAVFVNNVGEYGGGMSNNHNSSPILVNTIFLNNTSTNDIGGGMLTASGWPILINVAFVGNRTDLDAGAGIGSYPNVSVVVVNGIFWGNITSEGSNTEITQYNSKTDVTYSVVHDGIGSSILVTDPVVDRTLTYTPGYFMPTLKYGAPYPDNKGIFVIRSATTINGKFKFYYSIDHQKWYTNPNKIKIDVPIVPPSKTIEVTATDIQGNPRIGRPSPGVWAK